MLWGESKGCLTKMGHRHDRVWRQAPGLRPRSMMQSVDDLCLHLSAWGITGKVLSPEVRRSSARFIYHNEKVLQLRNRRRADMLFGGITRPQHESAAMHVGSVD